MGISKTKTTPICRPFKPLLNSLDLLYLRQDLLAKRHQWLLTGNAKDRSPEPLGTALSYRNQQARFQSWWRVQLVQARYSTNSWPCPLRPARWGWRRVSAWRWCRRGPSYSTCGCAGPSVAWPVAPPPRVDSPGKLSRSLSTRRGSRLCPSSTRPAANSPPAHPSTSIILSKW